MRNKTLIIAGCTRSGLTLMMQILHKGGYSCVGEFPSFEKYNIGEIQWDECQGKAIKLVDSHLQFPPEGDYYVIRLRRNPDEQVKSIIKFYKTLGLPIETSDDIFNKIKTSLKKDYKVIDEWANNQKGVIYVDFEVLIKNPEKILEILEHSFDIKLNPNATDCVIERETKCYNGMLEFKFSNI